MRRVTSAEGSHVKGNEAPKRTSMAMPGTNIKTASAWKNLRRMFRLAWTAFSSLAFSTPTLTCASRCSCALPILAAPCIASMPMPSSLLPAAAAAVARALVPVVVPSPVGVAVPLLFRDLETTKLGCGEGGFIRIRRARTRCVCHPPMADEIVAPQYPTSAMRLHPRVRRRGDHHGIALKVPTATMSTPSELPYQKYLAAQPHGLLNLRKKLDGSAPSIQPAHPPSMKQTMPARPNTTPSARSLRCRSRSVGHLRRCEGFEAMWRLMTRRGERRKPAR